MPWGWQKEGKLLSAHAHPLSDGAGGKIKLQHESPGRPTIGNRGSDTWTQNTNPLKHHQFHFREFTFTPTHRQNYVHSKVFTVDDLSNQRLEKPSAGKPAHPHQGGLSVVKRGKEVLYAQCGETAEMYPTGHNVLTFA